MLVSGITFLIYALRQNIGKSHDLKFFRATKRNKQKKKHKPPPQKKNPTKNQIENKQYRITKFTSGYLHLRQDEDVNVQTYCQHNKQCLVCLISHNFLVLWELVMFKLYIIC